MSADRRRPPSTGRAGPSGPRGAAVDHDRVVALLTPVVQGARLDLEDVEVRTAGRRRIVRVLVDGDRGVSLDAIAELSRLVSDALDDTDVLGEQPYTLEVSSPGVDRPLTLPRHWRRNIGRLVTVHQSGGGDEVTGRIAATDDDGVDLDLEPGQRRLAYRTITRAVVQVEFRSAPERDDQPAEPAAGQD